MALTTMYSTARQLAFKCVTEAFRYHLCRIARVGGSPAVVALVLHKPEFSISKKHPSRVDNLACSMAHPTNLSHS